MKTSALTSVRHGARSPLAATVLAALIAAVLGTGAAQAAEVSEQFASAGLHSATLEAQIDPQGQRTTCRAEYVSESSFAAGGWAEASTVPCEPEALGAGATARTATAALSGLELQTSYRFRFLADVEGATTPGPEGSFATFGLESFSIQALGEHGEPVTQAGAHPHELAVSFVTNSTQVKGEPAPFGAMEGVTTSTRPDGIIKDLLSELPPGLVGNPTAVPQCSIRVVEEQECSGNSQIGEITVLFGHAVMHAGLYDTIPPEGTAAEFAGEINASTDGFITAGVRTGGDYGITAGGSDISGRGGVYAVSVKLWGVPANAGHDPERRCPLGGHTLSSGGCASTLTEEKPFLSLPTACLGPLTATARVDSYQAPGEYVSKSFEMPAITGCSLLSFAPSLQTTPTVATAESPTGLKVDLHVPQDEEAEGLATSDLKDAVVMLPPGLTVNPSSATGLTGCSTEEFGLTTPVGTSPIHTTPGPAKCQPGSTLGTVEIETPLLGHPLPGAVYLAEPFQNPFDSLLAIYIAVDDPISGVVVKLAGHVEIGAEGQLTATFEETPQLPFENFELDFYEGPRSPLMTPATCGPYETTSTLTPWSAPQSGAPATPVAPVDITASPTGGACAASAAALPNAPSLEAGGESTQAGAFTPFVLHLNREDGSQRFSAVTVSPPPGLIGKVAGLPRCTEADLAAAEAASGTAEQASPSCPADSEVGTVTVGAGAGAEPFHVSGHVYFAGPYKGAPFSLAIVTPALAGPFDLGDVVVRAGIFINPKTAQVTVKSDPIPTELKGIPLDIRSIDVDLSRPGFTLNPTSCEPMSVSGEELSTTGQAAAISDRFQASGCNGLTFKPSFTASTSGKTSRKSGASLTTKIAYPSGGSEANVKYVKVTLPHSLAVRESTIEQACTSEEFDANPADCPAASLVGSAKAVTPVLGVPLTGPAYFVSNGHAKFPELVLVLQGEGVTIDLYGETFISKKGVTTSTFKTVPDAPISSFELTLPEGTHGLLAANGDLCDKSPIEPTTLIGQNGAVFRQTTKVAVDGCSKKLAFAGHHVKGRDAKVTVYVPAAGKLTLSGKGLGGRSKDATGRGTVSVELHQRKAGKQHTVVTVTFKPKKGRQQTKELKLEFER